VIGSLDINVGSLDSNGRDNNFKIKRKGYLESLGIDEKIILK
jgi:hypothetical protein